MRRNGRINHSLVNWCYEKHFNGLDAFCQAAVQLGCKSIELIGPGDVMRPWSWDDAGSHVRAEVGWEVLEPTRLAVLDHAAESVLVTPLPVRAQVAPAPP